MPFQKKKHFFEKSFLVENTEIDEILLTKKEEDEILIPFHYFPLIIY